MKRVISFYPWIQRQIHYNTVLSCQENKKSIVRNCIISKVLKEGNVCLTVNNTGMTLTPLIHCVTLTSGISSVLHVTIKHCLIITNEELVLVALSLYNNQYHSFISLIEIETLAYSYY